MFSKCNLFVALGDKMGDMRVMSKCATAVKICAVHARRPFPVSALASAIGKVSVIGLLSG